MKRETAEKARELLNKLDHAKAEFVYAKCSGDSFSEFALESRIFDLQKKLESLKDV